MSGILKIYNENKCNGCGKNELGGEEILHLSFCGGCKGCTVEPAYYCSRECQVADWPSLKKNCPRGQKKQTTSTYFADKYRKTKSGDYHNGDLELVTWDFIDDDGVEYGWGAVEKNESSELKSKFEIEFNGNRHKLIKLHDSAFRWTCCGLSAGEGLYGCDHHGDLEVQMCGCDFCLSGRPLPDAIYNSRSQHKVGLSLRRGPDPRSKSPMGELNFAMRTVFGMDRP